MANLSNINNILRTSSLGVGINCDAEFSLDIEKASANAILSLNSNGGSGAEYLLSSTTSGEFVLNKRYVGDRLTISSGGDATFAGNVLLNGYLSVEGTTGNTGGATDRWIGGDGTAGTWFYNVPTGSSHLFGINNSNVLTLNGTGATFAGNVDINGNLDVTSTASDAVFLRSSQATTTNVYITNTNATANNTANLFFAPANNVAGSYIKSTAIEDFSTSANRTSDLRFAVRKDGTFNEALIIDSSGNVGIGGTPSEQFEVFNDSASAVIMAKSSASTGDAYLILNASGTGAGRQSKIFFGDSADLDVGAIDYLHDSDSMQIRTAATTALTIDNSQNSTFAGNVTTPQINLNSAGGGIIDNQTGNIFIQTPSGTGWIFRNGPSGYDEKMRIDSSGKVIINDNTIGDKLLLAGDDAGTARGLMFNCSTTTNQGDTWDIDAQSSTGIIKFSTTSTERMRIDSEGSLIVGTATVAAANAAADNFVIKGTGAGVGLTISQDTNSGTGTIFFGDAASSSAAGFRYNHNTGDMAISAEDNITFACDNVGIGTTSPSAKFQVNGEGLQGMQAWFGNGFINNANYHYSFAKVGFSNTDPTGTETGAGFQFNTRNSSNGNWMHGYIYQPQDGGIAFGTGGAGTIQATERMRITSAGQIEFAATYNNTTASAANMHISSAGGQIFRSTSSLKYKTDVKDYDKGLNEVMQLQPKYYKGKNDGDTQFAGLIAEDVNDLGLSEFVQYAEDGTPDALAYTHMVALLVNAIQELKAEIEILKNK